MGDLLKVLALLGLGGLGIGALDNLDISTLQGTGLDGIAGDMKKGIDYIKEDAVRDIYDIIQTVDDARK